MVDIAALRAASPSALDDAARDWTAIAARLGEQATAMDGQVIAPLEQSWTGQAASVAIGKLNVQVKDLDVVREYADSMATLMGDASDGITNAQWYLKQADEIADKNQLTISADGSVTEKDSILSVHGVVSRVEELISGAPPGLEEASDLVRRALRLADETDEQVTAQLKKIGLFAGAETGNLAAAEAVLQSASKLGASVDSGQIPAKGTDPKQVNAWWNSLSAAQRQRLIDEFPTKIGWLDGLPATARDQANRLAMHQEQAQLQSALKGLGPEPPRYMPKTIVGPDGVKRTVTVVNPAWESWNAKAAPIEGKLGDIATVEKGLAEIPAQTRNAQTPDGQQGYLLGFDTNGTGHAIVAVGNPDTATTTANFVPGFTTTLKSSDGNIERSISLYNQAHLDAPAQKLSSIYWLNYNPPQWSAVKHVMGTGDATAGATNLASFQSGLSAAHQGTPPHTTVIGHSYGSLVVGEAAAHDHLKADDIIFVGSPGTGVQHASQLDVPASHVWSGADPGDIVPKLGPGTLVSDLPGVPASVKDEGWFGTNPATPQYGGNVFDAHTGRTFSLEKPLFVHEGYWNTDSTAFHNMCSIVTGQYQKVTSPK